MRIYVNVIGRFVSLYISFHPSFMIGSERSIVCVVNAEHDRSSFKYREKEAWIMKIVREMIDITFDKEFLSAILRIFAAMICGGVIGLERGKANQPAGMRTYMLVCLGAAVVMLTGEYVYMEYGAGDPSRLGAQVISGIGFLGAGSIVISGKSKIRGLTTAAGLWVSACIGLIVGIGYIKCGLIATLAVYVIIARLKRIEERMLRKRSWIEVVIKLDNVDYLADFHDVVEKMGMKIGSIQIYNKKEEIKSVIIGIQNCVGKDEEVIINDLRNINGIKSVRYIS